jgi:uncharacterized protein
MDATTNTGIDAVAPRLKRLVLQPASYRNVDGSFSGREPAATMSLAMLDLACRRVFDSPRFDRELDVEWHGVEPLHVPLAWYEEAIALMTERRPAALQLNHCFRTDGSLLNEDWTLFFARIQAVIGVHLAGPADLGDAGRCGGDGPGRHERAMRAVRLLQQHGLPFHAITALTENALDEPDRLFDFYVENAIKEVGFEIDQIAGADTQSYRASDGIEASFRKFIRRFFDLAWDKPGLLKVRELDSTARLLLSGVPARDERNQPFAVLTVGHDGTISTFSPELLGARHPRFGAFGFGHVASQRLCDIECGPLFQEISSEIRQGVEACKHSCEHFRWCGGGAPASKLFETGRFDATETMYCRLTRQVVLDEVIAGIEARIGRPPMPRDDIEDDAEPCHVPASAPIDLGGQPTPHVIEG